MEHKEYKRIVQDADVAILFIHGIVGTPNHFKDFVSLVPQSLSVCNLLLDGHGKDPRDFSKSSMAKWEAQVACAVEELAATHREIYVVAHSMGSLLAIEQALKNKKITKLFLLAVPLKLSIKLKMVTNSLKVFFGRIRTDDKEALAAKECYGIKEDKNPFNYIGWIPRYLELFKKIRCVRGAIDSLQTSCAVFQSANDEMVSAASAEYLKVNPYISVKELKQSGHYYYDKTDKELLLSEFCKMLG